MHVNTFRLSRPKNKRNLISDNKSLKSLFLASCVSFDFAVSDFEGIHQNLTGTYEAQCGFQEGTYYFKHTTNEYYVFRGSTGKWIFHSELGTANSWFSIIPQEKECPAIESGDWEYWDHDDATTVQLEGVKLLCRPDISW